MSTQYKGLSSEEVAPLLNKYGENILAEPPKKSLVQKLIDQLNNFLTLLLVGAAGASFFIGEPIDGTLIIAIVILNACFGLYQEAKAEGAIAALRKMTVSMVRVIRSGKEETIDSRYLVPGDLVFVEEGVKIPADGEIVEKMNLELNEAVLTGESLSIEKQVGDTVYSGTIVSKGRGLFKVVRTGMQTKFGQIALHLSEIEDTDTPLQKKLRTLTRAIGIVGIISAIIVFAISILKGSLYFPAFLLAVSLAVAVVPEGLPAVMTITLALGVHEMSKKKSIVRKLSAIEALGSITLIATDKTGTLTTNKMRVKELFVDDKVYADSLPRMDNHPFAQLITNGVICSTASLVYKHDHGTYDVLGDPTEGALLYLAHDAGVVPEDLRKTGGIIDEQAFDSVTKRMSVLFESKGKKMLYMKGAPESIMETVDRVQVGGSPERLTDQKRRRILDQVDVWARKGLRVLAFSYLPSAEQLQENSLIFLGMVAIHDAPRPEVAGAVHRAQEAGIRVIMITGDNERTAEAIGVVAGIIREGDDIVTGKQLEEYSDEQLMRILPRTSVFARTTPFHKHRIVQLYQKLGEVVAVTGDGVNDAIALKQADVGVAMGLVGTDVARETADMVITDDNFASIVNAVEEGRNIIKNLKNAIQYLLSCNISEAIALIVGMLLGFPHLFVPLQLLYINLVTDGVPALSLSFSPRSSRSMQQKPDRHMSLLKGNEWGYIISVGVVSSVLVLFSYAFFDRFMGTGVAHAASFTVLTLIQSFIYVDLWLSHRHITGHLHLFRAPVFWVAFLFPFICQLAITQVAPIARVFSIPTVPLGLFIAFSAISSLVLVGVRITKAVTKL